MASMLDMEAAEQVARRVSDEMGLPSPLLIRFSPRAAMYRSGEVALRVSRRDRGVLSSMQTVRLSLVLASHGVPTVVPRQEEVIEIGGYEVSLWEWVSSPRGAVIRYEALGEACAALHAVPKSAVATALGVAQLPRIADSATSARVRLERIAEWGLYGRSDIDLLRRLYSDLAGAVSSNDDQAVVVHGDLHEGNVIARSNGVVLCDWESIKLGPWVWDATPTGNQARLFDGQPEALSQFSSGYGADPTTYPAWEEWCRWEALLATLWCADLGLRMPTHEVEARRRFGWWRNPDAAISWRAL